ncbi:unnamed protein product, partial [Cylindrotheca closterium]
NALAAKDQALAQQKAATAALQAQLDALQRQTAHHLAIDSQPPAQNNEVSPDRSEFTTPPKKRKSKDISTTKRSVDRSTAGLKPPTKSTRTSTFVHFQQPKQRSWNRSQVQVDTTQMEGDTTTAVSQDKSLSSLTAASPGGVQPFFLPSPSGKSGDCLGNDHRCRSSLATRVTFQNVNGVPEEGDHVKQRQINSWLQDERVGIALLAEAKTFWPSVPEGHGWNDRMRQAMMKAKHKGFYSAVAYNKQQSRSSATTSFQWGGCIATVLSQVSHRAIESGSDSTGLGRWAYVRLQGKKLKAQGGDDPSGLVLDVNEAVRRPISRDLVVVLAYRPNREGMGESTVWAQHCVYFNSIKCKIDPRKAVVDDLCKQIQKWRDEGCEVLLEIDANEDLLVNSPDSIRQRFRECGMEEAILKRHPPTATHQQNQSNVPIDGIFTTSGVPVLAGGYYAFGEFVESDHRALWIDIDLNTALGNFTPQGSTFKPRKLTLLD